MWKKLFDVSWKNCLPSHKLMAVDNELEINTLNKLYIWKEETLSFLMICCASDKNQKKSPKIQNLFFFSTYLRVCWPYAVAHAPNETWTSCACVEKKSRKFRPPAQNRRPFVYIPLTRDVCADPYIAGRLRHSPEKLAITCCGVEMVMWNFFI